RTGLAAVYPLIPLGEKKEATPAGDRRGRAMLSTEMQAWIFTQLANMAARRLKSPPTLYSLQFLSYFPAE
ncbi:Ribitol-5-phosphate xylosyltransferase 1, partial [Dissostichus eleginoides]